jgi:CheY-like chemotaxis protein
MPNTRALIVDDSRSARHILGRMLESFGLEVDAVESAELALTYLQTARPDVIFMDHLMPGMDGFSAVRVIKANPDTATIPVLMYTSQEGDMYLSQARALGAMGVLPKTLKHADVAEALQHLNLPSVQVNPQMNQMTRAATPARAPTAAVPAERDPAQRTGAFDAIPATTPASASHDALPVSALNMPQLAHRIAAEVSAELERNHPHDALTERGWRAWALLASVLVAMLLGVVIYQQVQIQQQLSQLQAASPASHSQVASVAVTPPAVEPAATAAAPITPALPQVEIEAVPYGEVPLAGARLERLRTLIESLRSEQTHGVLRIEVFMADFCLSGNPVQGYAPAADEVLVSRCDAVGNPFGDALTVQQRQSVAFANLVASINSNVAGGIKVQLVDGGHKPLTTYPAPSATLTAAAWNAVAERNQRVEFTLPTTP